LNDPKLTSEDYATVKALVQGKIDAFMGFKFIQTNRLLKKDQGKFNADGTYNVGGALTSKSDSYQCLAWHGTDAMISGYGQDVTTEIAKRADKCFNEHLYMKMSLGHLRMEDVKCLTVVTKNVL
jgi:hypothetical protein